MKHEDYSKTLKEELSQYRIDYPAYRMVNGQWERVHLPDASFRIPSHDQAPKSIGGITFTPMFMTFGPYVMLSRQWLIDYLARQMQLWVGIFGEAYWRPGLENDFPLAVHLRLSGQSPSEDGDLFLWQLHAVLPLDDAIDFMQMTDALGAWVTLDEATDEYVAYTPHLPAELVAAARAALTAR